MRRGAHLHPSPPRGCGGPTWVRPAARHVSTKKKKHGIRHAHLEETQRADIICHVEREAVVDTSRDDDQVAGGYREADPCV
jgi:hypothetical protein